MDRAGIFLGKSVSQPFSSSGGGPSLGTNSVIRTNADTINEDITFVAGGVYENGSSVGPITIASGKTVTVASGCVWTVIGG